MAAPTIAGHLSMWRPLLPFYLLFLPSLGFIIIRIDFDKNGLVFPRGLTIGARWGWEAKISREIGIFFFLSSVIIFEWTRRNFFNSCFLSHRVISSTILICGDWHFFHCHRVSFFSLHFNFQMYPSWCVHIRSVTFYDSFPNSTLFRLIVFFNFFLPDSVLVF